MQTRVIFVSCVFGMILRLVWENLRCLHQPRNHNVLPDRLETVENWRMAEPITGQPREPPPADITGAPRVPPAAEAASLLPELDISEESCSRWLPKLKPASNQTSCAKVGENPYPTMNRKHVPFPTDLPCKLVVIAAGSPRCGSTTQLAYAKDALRLLGVPSAMSEYWNIHLHHKVIPEDQKTAKGTELSDKLRIAANQKDSLLVMKSHEYDPRLIRLCQHALVLTSHRHPFETERSKKDTFHAQVTREKYAKNYWNVPEVATPQRCWVDSGSWDRVVKVVDQAYEGFKEDPVHSFLEVFASVEEAVLQAGIPTKRPKAIAKELREVIDHLSDEKNQKLPSSRQELTGADYWTTDEQTKIACLYRRWFDRYNYTYT